MHLITRKKYANHADHIKYSVRISRKRQRVSITKTGRLEEKKKIAVYTKNPTEPIMTASRKNSGFLSVTARGAYNHH